MVKLVPEATKTAQKEKKICWAPKIIEWNFAFHFEVELLASILHNESNSHGVKFEIGKGLPAVKRIDVIED